MRQIAITATAVMSFVVLFCGSAQAQMSKPDHQALSSLYYLQSDFIRTARSSAIKSRINRSKARFVSRIKQNSDQCWKLFVGYFPEDYINDIDIYTEAKWIATEQPVLKLFSKQAASIHQIASRPSLSSPLHNRLRVLDQYWSASIKIDLSQQSLLTADSLCLSLIHI